MRGPTVLCTLSLLLLAASAGCVGDDAAKTSDGGDTQPDPNAPVFPKTFTVLFKNDGKDVPSSYDDDVYFDIKAVTGDTEVLVGTATLGPGKTEEKSVTLTSGAIIEVKFKFSGDPAKPWGVLGVPQGQQATYFNSGEVCKANSKLVLEAKGTVHNDPAMGDEATGILSGPFCV